MLFWRERKALLDGPLGPRVWRIVGMAWFVLGASTLIAWAMTENSDLSIRLAMRPFWLAYTFVVWPAVLAAFVALRHWLWQGVL